MPAPPDRYWTDLAGAHAQADGAVTAVESRVELMIRACQGAKLPLPGVDAIPAPRHALSAKGAAVIRYLTGILPTAAELTRRVQVSVFRFVDAQGAVAVAAACLALREVRAGLPEGLRRKAYFLAHYGETFADEPVLSQIFPRAAPTPARAATAPLPPAPTRPLAAPAPDTEAQRAQAKRLLASLDPWIAVLAPLVRRPDGAGPAFARMLAPEGRDTRVLGLRLQFSPEASQLAEAMVAAHAKLAALAAGPPAPDAWKEAAFDLSERAAAAQAHPLLRDVGTLAARRGPAAP